MAVKGAGNIFLRGRVCWEGRSSTPHTILAPLPKGGWHGEAVTGGFFPARTHGKCAAVCPARNPSTSLRLVPLPLGKGGSAFWVVRWGGSSGRPTPTRHLPIELRKGRRPRRPVASQVAGDRKGRPYGGGTRSAVRRADVGSELSAAGGRGSEVSEWPRSKF